MDRWRGRSDPGDPRVEPSLARPAERNAVLPPETRKSPGMNRLARLLWSGCLASWLAASAAARGGEPGEAFFEQKIRPVLVKECYSCHSAEAKRVKGGLRLDTRAGVLKGGDSGPAVVPGKPEESPLLEAVRHEGIAMPPDAKLPERVIADFERWVKIGAPDPRGGHPPAP